MQPGMAALPAFSIARPKGLLLTAEVEIHERKADYKGAGNARSVPRRSLRQEDEMFCQKCGKESNEGAPFCAHCGKRISEAGPEPASLGLKLWVLTMAAILAAVVAWFVFELGRNEGRRRAWNEQQLINANVR